MQSTKQIHIKATCENENRRFCIAEAKFDSLKKLISNLFSLANGADFTVKYKDDENDLVTISSDDELAFAVNMFPTDILRIVVEVPKPNCAAPCSKWQNKCDRRQTDDRRCDWLATKRERIQAKLKALEGTDFQAKPGLFYKQEHLKKKLQNIDNKLACKENKETACENKPGRCPRNNSGADKHPPCNWMTIKKEKIQARLRELEGTDFHENPGLFWKKEKLERKLQAIEAKCQQQGTADVGQRCGRGGKFGGRGRGYGGRHCQPQTGNHCDQDFSDQKRSCLEAKKGRIQARLKEMESNASQAQPGSCDWRREHLKRKLEMIEAKLASFETKGAEGTPSTVPTEPVPPVQVVSVQATPQVNETKRIRDALKLEKQQAVTHCHAKKLEYQTAKRTLAADQNKEEVAKLHEEYVKAQEIAFEKKKALAEFNAKTRASREAKN